jgi:hypothetical protein
MKNVYFLVFGNYFLKFPLIWPNSEIIINVSLFWPMRRKVVLISHSVFLFHKEFVKFLALSVLLIGHGQAQPSGMAVLSGAYYSVMEHINQFHLFYSPVIF